MSGRARWSVEESVADSFEGGSGRAVRVFHVWREPRGRNAQPTHVWYTEQDNSAACCSCSGILTAMMESCRHARAVKRHLAWKGRR